MKLSYLEVEIILHFSFMVLSKELGSIAEGLMHLWTSWFLAKESWLFAFIFCFACFVEIVPSSTPCVC